MKKSAIIGIIIGVIVLLIIIFLIITGNNSSEIDNSSADNITMLNCGELKNPGCFLSRMNLCLPVTGWFDAGGSAVEMTILGQENETCHFQRKINNVLNLDCYFPIEAMNVNLLSQTLGDDKGLQSVVDSACRIS